MIAKSKSGSRVKSRSGRNPIIITSVVVLTGLILVIYFFTLKDFSREKRINRNAREVQGYVYDVAQKELMTHGIDGTKVTHKYTLYIRYRVEGRDFHITKTLSYPYRKDTITIRYDTLNPAEAYVVLE